MLLMIMKWTRRDFRRTWTSGSIRTRSLLGANEALYQVELRAHV